ncbi:MAG: CpaF family protein [Gemmatimonas sp.]
MTERVFGRRSQTPGVTATPGPAVESSAPVQGSPGFAEATTLMPLIQTALLGRADVGMLARLPDRELTEAIDTLVAEILAERRLAVAPAAGRALVQSLVDGIRTLAAQPPRPEPHAAAPVAATAPAVPTAPATPPTPAAPAAAASVEAHTTPAAAPKAPPRPGVETAKAKVHALLLERIDVAAASKLTRAELSRQISAAIVEILAELKVQLNLNEQKDLVTSVINDMLGLGPLELLLSDETITDIMVNGPKQIYIERKGKLELTDVVFRDNAHVMNVATRIVTRIGRRVDETCPLVDARLEDGSRVNIIIPPLALDGPSISIRKFSKKGITLDIMANQANLSAKMANVLKIAGRCRCNILISGGTGSGKTTLLNAISQMIDHGERVVTIEDAAELQLQQPHVVRLETRPANLEGTGEITMRDLVKNALRMRPDRIIMGEVRGAEALDMLQAMNTGHDGSMCTLHANTPREAITRLENMVAMANFSLPSKAVRTQIASAVHLIVQISRMRDGMRRIQSITEVVGMEGDVITTQPLFEFEFKGEEGGKLVGEFRSSGLRPHFLSRAEYFGLGRALIEAAT